MPRGGFAGASGIPMYELKMCFFLVVLIPLQALPIFLDRLANPVAAVIISVTVVLVFGEIIPQAICSRYGLKVGAYSAWFVKLLMIICSPLSWPIGKLLDYVLGPNHSVRAAVHMLRGRLYQAGFALSATLCVKRVQTFTGRLSHFIALLRRLFMCRLCLGGPS